MLTEFAREYSLGHSYYKAESRRGLWTERPQAIFMRRRETVSLALPSPDRDRRELVPRDSSIESEYAFGILSDVLFAAVGVRYAAQSRAVGLLRLHRSIPTPSALCATELFVHFHGAKLSGIYHYDSLTHTLNRVRSCSVSARPSPRVASELDALHIVVAAVPQRLFSKYTNFSYRLAALEAGHAIEAATSALADAGLKCSRSDSYFDDVIEANLDLSPNSVSIMGVITGGSAEPELADCLGVRHEPQPRSGWWSYSSGDLRDIPWPDDVARLECGYRHDRGTQRRSAVPYPGRNSIAIHDGYGNHVSARNSGVGGAFGLPTAFEKVQAAAILAAGREAKIIGDYVFRDSGVSLEFVCGVQNVAGMTRGAFVYDRALNHLRKLGNRGALPADALLDRLALNSDLMCASWVILGSYQQALREHGARGYRVLNIGAGIIAQRICETMSRHDQRLFCRPICAFSEVSIDDWLVGAFADLVPVYVVLTGINALSLRAWPLGRYAPEDAGRCSDKEAWHDH